jgi:hypothetical protein
VPSVLGCSVFARVFGQCWVCSAAPCVARRPV